MTAGLLFARQRERSHSPLASWPRSIACGDGLSGEFMTSMANLASTEADADHRAADAAEAGPFVLNLCSSTTPMALAQTDLPELKRFTFFVSRRFEEGRERFRLHMGYFTTLGEAEEWLSVVREIYPGAWAGEAPGKKLRARAAAAAAVAQHSLGPQPRSALPNLPTAAAPAPAPYPAAAHAAVNAPAHIAAHAPANGATHAAAHPAAAHTAALAPAHGAAHSAAHPAAAHGAAHAVTQAP